jgi:hypothetical protein
MSPKPGEIAEAVALAMRPTDYPRRWLARKLWVRVMWIGTCCQPTRWERFCDRAVHVLMYGQIMSRCSHDRKLRGIPEGAVD